MIQRTKTKHHRQGRSLFYNIALATCLLLACTITLTLAADDDDIKSSEISSALPVALSSNEETGGGGGGSLPLDLEESKEKEQDLDKKVLETGKVSREKLSFAQARTATENDERLNDDDDDDKKQNDDDDDNSKKNENRMRGPKSNSTAGVGVCSDGLMLSVWQPQNNITWGDRLSRGFVYLLAMVYLFIGVSIVSDRFMAAIEVITSKEKEVVIKKKNGEKENGTKRGKPEKRPLIRGCVDMTSRTSAKSISVVLSGRSFFSSFFIQLPRVC